MKTYIFSNCKKNDFTTYGQNLLNKVPVDSRIVILNKGEVYYHIKEFKNYPNQIMILRSCGTHGLCSYFGLQNLVGSPQEKLITDVVCFRPVDDIAFLEIGHHDGSTSCLKQDIPWMVEYRKATDGKDATTGYSAYYLVQDLYGVKPEDIVLVNFYGNNDSSTGKWSGHAWSYEDKWLQDKHRIYC